MIRRKPWVAVVCFILGGTVCSSPVSAKWKYFRAGNAEDRTATPRGVFALMGGGDQDPAFRILCEHANGGDFLILRANTEDDYAQKVNEDVRAMCPLNSAATIVFDDRENSNDPKIPEIISHAEVVFIAGGDQSNYVRFWQDTPVQDALNRHIAAGKPIGGSSAGLAVLGEYSFASIIDTIHSPEALKDPYGNKVTISREFLRIPLLTGMITDTHFAKRDRMGRLLVFLARIIQDGWNPHPQAIAVEEAAAVIVEPDGKAKVIGGGPAFFVSTTSAPKVCRKAATLEMDGFRVHRVLSGGTFDLKAWKGEGGDDYTLSTSGAEVKSSSPHGIY